MEKIIKEILNKENISYSSIKKATSGFTNLVYFVDDRLVIKIVAGVTKPEKLQKEIAFYKNGSFDFLPKYISSGKVDETDYLIITKIAGKPLFSIWHTLDEETKRDIIRQIVDILKAFHSVKTCDFLSGTNHCTDWVKKWNDSFSHNISLLDNMGYDTSYLKGFLPNIQKIFAEQKPALIYNDAHFDNFLYNCGKVSIIDFDRVIFSSIDYELLIIKEMLDNPIKFASEEDEPKVNIRDYAFIYDYIKKLYPALFDFRYIEDRVYIYQFIYELGQAYEYNKGDKIAILLAQFRSHFEERKF